MKRGMPGGCRQGKCAAELLQISEVAVAVSTAACS